MMQAFAFPIPIFGMCFEVLRRKLSKDSPIFKRFNLALGVASIWLFLSIGICPSKFAFGYDLYSVRHKIVVGFLHGITGIFCLGMGFRSTTTSIVQTIRGLLDSLFQLGPPPTDSK